MEERSPCGSGGCITCPFSCTDEAEQVQNYGCLPDRPDIIRMKEESGHNWSCHSDDKVLCGGFARYIQEERPDLNIKEGKLISYDVWYREGKEEAIKLAGIQEKSLWKQVQDLTFEIAGEVDHGECFYEEEMLEDFQKKLDMLKSLSRELYLKNKKEMEEGDN